MVIISIGYVFGVAKHVQLIFNEDVSTISQFIYCLGIHTVGQKKYISDLLS